MTDSDLPSIEEPPLPRARWRRSAVWLLLEVILISASVFLGLLGQQWVENRQHREQAKETLARFRTEIAANRDTVKRTYDYHAPLQKTLKAFVGADAKGRESITLNYSRAAAAVPRRHRLGTGAGHPVALLPPDGSRVPAIADLHVA